MGPATGASRRASWREDTRGLKDEKGKKKQKEAVPQGPPLFFLEMVFSS
jgi:hypothetical protein